jgi:hypothetical protein
VRNRRERVCRILRKMFRKFSQNVLSFKKKQYLCEKYTKNEVQMDTMFIELTNQKATRLLYELEELDLIKILQGNIKPVKKKLSEKYKGFITREEGEQLNNHINQMRYEWNDI